MLSLSRAELQRHTLRQQCLSAPAGTVEQAVTHMLGCRGAEGSTPYLSLLWRVSGFAPDQFDKAVHQDRTLLRVRGPRGTYYWVTPALAPLFLAAARTEPHRERLLAWGMQEGEYRAIEAEITSAVTGGPMPVRDLTRRMPAALKRPVKRKGLPASTALAVTLEAMQLAGQVTLLKEPGFARHRTPEYYGDARDITRPNLVGLVADLYPTVQPGAWEQNEARTELVRAYIKTYGPVTPEDIAWWTGWTKREVQAHLRSIAGEVAEVQVQGLPDTFLIHTPTWNPAADNDPLTAWLLPGGDSLMKGYAGFARFLASDADDHNVLRFMPAVLIGGLGRGNWGYRLATNTAEVLVELFTPPDEALREPLERAASRIGHLLTGAPGGLRIRQRTDRWNPRAVYP
jgi:hypothetical protein